MRLKQSIFLTVIVLLFIVLHGPRIVFGASQLSEAEVSEKYGVTFPVAELNNCGNIAECGAYCRKDGNLSSCMKFVNAHQLAKADVLSFNISQLGNCQIGSDCRNFCNRDENITKCIDFADTYDLLSPSNIEISRAFTKAIASGGTPGSCRTLEECDNYCDDNTHTNECLDYVGKKKLVAEEELNATRKVAEGFRQGIETPGKCRGITECDDYCVVPAHSSECMTYAKKVGFYPSEIAADTAGKFMAMARQGATPGGCTSKESCDAYCAVAAHGVECTDFAVSAGLLSKDEAEAIKKYGGTGPGGCKSKDECSAFCNQTSNQNVCLQYAKDHNIPVQFSGPGGCSSVDSCTAYCKQHPDDATCKQYSSQYGGSKGPGGCTDQASCTAYCKEHYKDDAECAKSAGQYGGFSGPGGCKDEASCKDYCTKNQSDAACQKMSGQYGGFSGPGGCKDKASCTSYCTSNPKDSACAQFVGGDYQQKMQQYQRQGAPSMPNVRGATDSRGLLQIIFDELVRR